VPSIAILGAGAVGGLLAGALGRSGTAVTLVASEETAVTIGRMGLSVESPRFGSFHLWAPVTERLEEPVDVLVVAVKAPALEAALERIGPEPGVVVPLLNGVEHMATLRERFAAVVAGTIRVQAHRDGAARVVHRAGFVTVSLAEPGCEPLARALRGAEVDVHEGGAEADVLWGKLARLAPLALATAAFDAPLGDVREEVRAAAAEVAAIARAEGAAVDAETVVAELDALPDDATSSLRGDVSAGRADERDAIAGAVSRAARRHGIPCPRVDGLAAAVRLRFPER
jgi:2-dehydropantoate 2-reductase